MKNLELASSSEMSASARADEIVAILAAAIVRTLAADEPKQREVGPSFLPDQRVHTPPLSRGEVVINEKQASVAARIAELACLPMSELWTVWDRYFPRRPDYPNRTHVESRIAYKLQEEAFGGLAPETKQRLEAIGAKHSKIKPRAKPREFDFAPGTLLLREWGEREHRVTVTAEGLFEYQGSNFKSLTAVARHITGSHWSGPLFFGLGKGGAR